MELHDIEADLQRQDRQVNRLAALLTPVLLLLCVILAGWAWVHGDRPALVLLRAAIAFSGAGMLVGLWLRGVARGRRGPGPPPRGTLWSPLRYRWYHSPDGLAQVVYWGVLALAFCVLALSD